MGNGNVLIPLLLLFAFMVSCTNKNPMPDNKSKINDEVNISAPSNEQLSTQSFMLMQLSAAVENSQLPPGLSLKIQENITENPDFLLRMSSILQSDPYLWILVDKERSLPSDYEPDDLVELKSGSYLVNRTGLFLRKAAADSLEEMAGAARREGLTLVASSAYRSYDYQAEVYQRNVRQLGQEAADRESARAGHSQHQTGLVMDFGSITDAFAATAEGIWLAANASRFGWSLSYPQGYEPITGYIWESWHYRYVGKELASFINDFFDGIQQYALRFLYEWEKLKGSSKNY